MPKKKLSLADQVVVTERRSAPRVQARVQGRSAWIGWLLLVAVAIVLAAAGVGFLRLKHFF